MYVKQAQNTDMFTCLKFYLKHKSSDFWRGQNLIQVIDVWSSFIELNAYF